MGFARIADDAAECLLSLFVNPGRSRVPQTVVERTASPRRKQATAWSGGAELFGRGDPGERAGGNDSDAVASGPDRRSDPGGLGTPTPRALILSRNSAWE